MNNKTLIKLEFDKIISMLENEASSFRGKQLCRRLKPVTDLTKIDLLQEQTAAAFTRIIKKGRISFGDAAPVEESLKRLEIGGALNTAELLRICRLPSNGPSHTDGMTRRKILPTVLIFILTDLSRSHLFQMKLKDASFPKMKSVMTQAVR